MGGWLCETGRKLYTDALHSPRPAASNSAEIIFMVTGPDKAPALKAVLEGPFEPEQFRAIAPAQNGKLLWLVETLPLAACFQQEFENSRLSLGRI